MVKIRIIGLLLATVFSNVLAVVETDQYHPEVSGNVQRINREIVETADGRSMKLDVESIHDVINMDDDVMHPPPVSRDSKKEKSAQRQALAGENTAQFWYDSAAKELDEALLLEKRNKNVAKNVILFLGDGMGIPSITSGRILKGQNNGQSGEETKLMMDTFPHAGLSKTYNVDHQVPDSAGTGTAYMTGVKTDMAVLGYNAAITPGVCSTTPGNEVSSVLEDSHKEGKAVGVVTTTRLNHATPGSAYAHSAYRYWYSDADLPDEAKINGCKDIAYQLYAALPNIQVALGGGRGYFRPNTTLDEEYKTNNFRTDGQELIEKWKNNMEDMGRNAKYVWNKQQFDAVDASSVDHLWGMFEPKDMNYETDRSTDGAGEPSLAEMTQKAIEILQKDEDGFFLLVEGGRIDHAHHESNAYRSLHEVISFDDAIAKAVELTSESDTLLVVTADHSHTFTLGGYTIRGNPLFGKARDDANPRTGLDGLPYTALNYGNGEGFQGGDSYSSPNEPVVREDLNTVDTGAKDYLQQSGVPLYSESHGGEDVAILARGPMSHLFHGVHQQSYVAHVMRYASCVGENKAHCENQPQTSVATEENVTFLGYNLNPSEAAGALYALFALELTFSIVIIGIGVYTVKKNKSFLA
nr:alkaline phosphatase-like [Ciona intestinalis]|eukprot:XP_002129634.1 alkaline phosphatase-like [Ciona intestinalis]